LAEAKRRGVSKIECKDIAVIVNRQQGALEKAKDSGLRLHSLIKFVDEGLLHIQDMMDPEEYDTITSYLKNPSGFQP
jgi:orotate phosphoribosyltransferase